MQLNPDQTTARDICNAALIDANAIGVGQTALAHDLNDAQARLQWMLQQWERKRWLVYHLVEFALVSTGAESYTLGPGGDLDTGSSRQFTNQFNFQVGNATSYQAYPISARPARIESAFLRQISSAGNPPGSNFIDYPLNILQSKEDYDKISLKTLQSFPGYLWYDTGWPKGTLYPWPVPQPSIYELHVTVMAQLPPAFATASTVISLPYEYFSAIVLNLALRLRVKYGIPTFPGDQLPGMAKEALNVLRGSNTQISRLSMPGDLVRPQLYNIFSDQVY